MRTWDAEAGGWRVQIPGTDRTYLSNSDEGRALESAWEQAAQQKRDAHFANIGNWQQYENDSLEDFTSALNADPWYSSRLAGYANRVKEGDTLQFNNEFGVSGGDTARGHELTNRYIALLNQGYTNQEIMGAGYGNDGSSWASWDTGASQEGGGTGGGDTGGGQPTVDLSNYTPLEVGTGFMGGYNAVRYGDQQTGRPQSAGPRPVGPPAVTGGPSNPPTGGPFQPPVISDPGPSGGFLEAYNAKRTELANKPSVMSLFKEMENYEQSPQ